MRMESVFDTPMDKLGEGALEGGTEPAGDAILDPVLDPGLDPKIGISSHCSLLQLKGFWKLFLWSVIEDWSLRSAGVVASVAAATEAPTNKTSCSTPTLQYHIILSIALNILRLYDGA